MKFFDALAETRVTRNRLPHWQQDGATYFITYRLADSIPQVLMNQWRQDSEHWMELNPQPWDHFANVARYIRRNPVKAKLEEGHYRLFEDEAVKRILG